MGLLVCAVGGEGGELEEKLGGGREREMGFWR